MNAVSTHTMTSLSIGKGVSLGSAEEMEAMLRHIGATRYHSLHPFHRLLHGSDERKAAEQAGWQIPADGTEITL